MTHISIVNEVILISKKKIHLNILIH